MTTFVDKLVETTRGEWEFFGYSTRSIDEVWHIFGEEYDDPYRQRVREYWKSVGHPSWDGKTKQPWSAAFITWCFQAAKAGKNFPGDATHSVYVDRIRRNPASALQLKDPKTVSIAVGDLLWNSRRGEHTSDAPQDYDEAVARLKAGDFFDSHVDIVVEVRSGACDSIGGNVSNRKDPTGSVTRSTWRLGNNARMIDARKTWVGVVKNGL